MDEGERFIQTNNTHAGYSSLALTLSLHVYAYTYTSARIRMQTYIRVVTCVLCAGARALLRLENRRGRAQRKRVRAGGRDTKTRRISGGARTAHPEFNSNTECLATAFRTAALVKMTKVSEITARVASALQFRCASSQASFSLRLTLRHAGVSLATNASRRHRHQGG